MTQPPDSPREFQRLLQEQVGISRSYAIELASGKRNPSLVLAFDIQEKTGILARYWVDRQAENA